MDFSKFFYSQTFKAVVIIIGVSAVTLFVFTLGMEVGSKRANFSCRWGENYYRNFLGPRAGGMRAWRNFGQGDFLNAHGAVGKIIKTEPPLFIMQGRDKVEKAVLVNESTIIERFREELKLDDLAVNDEVAVIGDPNGVGQIEAKLIRLLPSSSAKGTFPPAEGTLPPLFK